MHHIASVGKNTTARKESAGGASSLQTLLTRPTVSGHAAVHINNTYLTTFLCRQ